MAAPPRLVSWVLVVSSSVCFLTFVTGCTPISKVNPIRESDAGPDAAAADGGDGMDASPPDADGGGSATDEPPPSKGESCSTDGAMRCAGNGGATRQREVCQRGFWMPAAACGDGE